jgi:hypothetical protein
MMTMTKIKLFDIKAFTVAADFSKRRLALVRQLQLAKIAIGTFADPEQIKAKIDEINAQPDSRLTAANATAIHTAVQEANGKASAHTYGSPSVLVTIAASVENQLIAHGVPIKDRAGVKVSAISGVPTSRSYNRQSSSAIATKVTFERGGSAWYVTAIERVTRHTGPGGEEKIITTLTDAARQAVIKNALSVFA